MERAKKITTILEVSRSEMLDMLEGCTSTEIIFRNGSIRKDVRAKVEGPGFNRDFLEGYACKIPRESPTSKFFFQENPRVQIYRDVSVAHKLQFVFCLCLHQICAKTIVVGILVTIFVVIVFILELIRLSGSAGCVCCKSITIASTATAKFADASPASKVFFCKLNILNTHTLIYTNDRSPL